MAVNINGSIYDVGNPYFFIRDYEDKGVYVLIKKDKGVDVSYLDRAKNIPFIDY